jgi:hypothetical protein
VPRTEFRCIRAVNCPLQFAKWISVALRQISARMREARSGIEP